MFVARLDKPYTCDFHSDRTSRDQPYELRRAAGVQSTRTSLKSRTCHLLWIDSSMDRCSGFVARRFHPMLWSSHGRNRWSLISHEQNRS